MLKHSDSDRRGWMLAAAAGVLVALALAGCSVQVKEDEAEKRVDIRTPVGDVKVQTEVDARETGLALYPGARPLRERGDDPQSAHVDVSSSLFGVKVVAAKFETDDSPEKVLAFYRDQMKPYGTVVECRDGDLDFKSDKGPRLGEPTCKPGKNRREGHVELAVGDEGRHRIVAVTPKDGRTEFAVVYVQTRGERETL